MPENPKFLARAEDAAKRAKIPYLQPKYVVRPGSMEFQSIPSLQFGQRQPYAPPVGIAAGVKVKTLDEVYRVKQAFNEER